MIGQSKELGTSNELLPNQNTEEVLTEEEPKTPTPDPTLQDVPPSSTVAVAEPDVAAEGDKGEEQITSPKPPVSSPLEYDRSQWGREKEFQWLNRENGWHSSSQECGGVGGSSPNNKQEWQENVLRELCSQFEQDLAASERVLEEKRARDKRMRLEIKMLKTQIAVYRMQRRMANFTPTTTSTPRPKQQGDQDTAGEQSSNSCDQQSFRDTTTNQNSLLRSRDWLSANQGP
eukprot:sb/3469441/